VPGVSPLIRPWKATGKLPYYLQDAYTLHEMQLLGQRFGLASPRGKAASAALRVWLSLQGSGDERVQMGLNELQRHFPW
jgi:hypothetical protein